MDAPTLAHSCGAALLGVGPHGAGTSPCSEHAGHRRAGRAPRSASRFAVVTASMLATMALQACAPGVFEGGIDDGDTGSRVAAIQRVERSTDRTSIPKVVECLASNDPVVRQAAYRCLRNMTGETLGYRPDDPPLMREQAVNRWVEWCRQQGLAPGGSTS